MGSTPITRSMIFQSTLPLRGATRIDAVVNPPPDISIHAPLTGSDIYLMPDDSRFDISIHAPLTGSDVC